MSRQFLFAGAVLVSFAVYSAAADVLPKADPVARIEAALQAPAAVDFVETPLKDVVNSLSDRHKIDIQLDLSEEGLPAANADSHTPVTMHLQGVSLESVLNQIVEHHRLAWTIHNEVLLITSRDKAESEDYLVTKIYDVADLVSYVDSQGKPWDDYRELEDAITNTVNPKTWADPAGGPGIINAGTFGTAKLLAISQTNQVQREIAKFLEDVRAIAAKSTPTKTTEPLPNNNGTSRIEAALREPITAKFVDTPLKDVVAYLRDRSKIEIQLDTPEDSGIEPAARTTLNVQGVSLELVLSRIVDKHNLAWTIHDEVLLITSPSRAESDDFVVTKVYDVADLIEYVDSQGKPFDSYTALIEIIISTVNPKTWAAPSGGPGTIKDASLGTAKALAVLQSYQAHRQIDKLLADIRAVATKYPRRDLPRRDRPQPMLGGQMGGYGGGGTGAMSSTENSEAVENPAPAKE